MIKEKKKEGIEDLRNTGKRRQGGRREKKYKGMEKQMGYRR